MGTTQGFCMLSWTNPGSRNIPSPQKKPLYGHWPITQTIQIRQPRHMDTTERSRDELMWCSSLWTLTHGHIKVSWPTMTNIDQVCVDTGCYEEDFPEVMTNRNEWRERVRGIHAVNMRWRWYICVCVCVCECKYIYIYIYIYIYEGRLKSSETDSDQMRFIYHCPYCKSTHFFHQCCSAWIPLVKKKSSAYEFFSPPLYKDNFLKYLHFPNLTKLKIY